MYDSLAFLPGVLVLIALVVAGVFASIVFEDPRASERAAATLGTGAFGVR